MSRVVVLLATVLSRGVVLLATALSMERSLNHVSTFCLYYIRYRSIRCISTSAIICRVRKLYNTWCGLHSVDMGCQQRCQRGNESVHSRLSTDSRDCLFDIYRNNHTSATYMTYIRVTPPPYLSSSGLRKPATGKTVAGNPEQQNSAMTSSSAAVVVEVPEPLPRTGRESRQEARY